MVKSKKIGEERGREEGRREGRGRRVDSCGIPPNKTTLLPKSRLGNDKKLKKTEGYTFHFLSNLIQFRQLLWIESSGQVVVLEGAEEAI